LQRPRRDEERIPRYFDGRAEGREQGPHACGCRKVDDETEQIGILPAGTFSSVPPKKQGKNSFFFQRTDS